MPRYFGTDGVRGPFGGPLLNVAFSRRLGRALGENLRPAPDGEEDARPEVVVGRDTRVSGGALVDALCSGLDAAGVQAIRLGVLPTPAIVRVGLDLEAAAMVAVTASHNPAADNGIKVMDAGGTKVGPEWEEALEDRIDELDTKELEGGVVSGPGDEASAEWKDHYLKASLAGRPPDLLAGRTLVVDCAHGATAATTPEALRRLGATVHAIGVEPDGLNINAGCGSEHLDVLGREVLVHEAALGLAHDGDGDRVRLVDSRGEPVPGEVVLGLLACHRLERGMLPGGHLVTTVHSNLGLDQAVRAAGGRVTRTPVGDRWVAAKLKELNGGLGGESSGHIILPAFSPTGDGLVAALDVLTVLAEGERTLADWLAAIPLFPRREANFRVTRKPPLAAAAAVTACQAAWTERFGQAGRMLLRYSGTEPVLRAVVEARDPDQVESAFNDLAGALRQDGLAE
ncbi:MAG: phosphoglucosamine mutase [Opitutales bacterium]